LLSQNQGEQHLLIEEEVTFFNASSFKVERRTTGAIIRVVVLSVVFGTVS